MNICFFNSEIHWGGGEKWHYKMAQLFNNAGHKVWICANKNSQLEKRAKESNISVKEFKISKYSFLNPIKILEVITFLNDNKIDAIIMNNPLDLKIGTIAAVQTGVKNIVYRRGMPHPIRNTMFNRWLFSKQTHVIAISQEIKRSILANNPNMVKEDKFLLLYNSIDDNDYHVEIKNPGQPLVFGTTGRLVPQKGQFHLIEAAAILKERGYDFKIKIAGIGPLENELKNCAKKYNVEDKIEFTGFIKDLNPFLNSIDVFVFPSYFEGSAVSIVEAIYFGKPVITFNVSTMPELVQDGYNGFLTEFKNSQKFAEKMIYFIKNPKIIEEMRENSFKIREKYNLHNVFSILEEALMKNNR